ncbi:MAG: hypothetical protein IKN02_03505 [Prevotella sp.]|nr:hypothetical protein [Prevotella sp.]
MKDIRTLHNEAMDIALRGDIAAKASDPASEESIALYTEAFEKERELRQLLQNIYAQSGRDEEVVVYQLEVPDRDRTRFEGILHQLGLAASNMRKVIGKVALL